VQNIITLGQPLLGERYVAQKKEEKEKEKNPKNRKKERHSVKVTI
jgi:hypothetical protein